ncbi:RNA polymerase sigma factor [Stieleria varia]|uniref:RNA polymerase sigma factor n=1 Tax=Stieleria varia TaxID=2528005 RepID=A0A5C6BAL3_9BACT|nr:sigma-70 family RNA polymerase sigma factor [Stieleria varia]TWU07544.1 RNA polymerase sigma factor [Stieleria varia]
MPETDVTSTVATPPHAADRLLVEDLLRGDAGAWQTFVDRYGRLVRSRVADVAHSFGRAGDDSAIDDATAEVFAALLGNNAAVLRAFQGRSSLGTYVAVIATRSATRGFSRRRIAVGSPGQLLDLDLAVDQGVTDPSQRAIRREQNHRLHVLLERLPEKQREIVERFHLHAASYTEISQSLQIPIGSIGPTLRRAEAKLRQWMEEENL